MDKRWRTIAGKQLFATGMRDRWSIQGAVFDTIACLVFLRKSHTIHPSATSGMSSGHVGGAKNTYSHKHLIP